MPDKAPCNLQAGAEDLPGAPLVGGRPAQRFLPFSAGGRDCVGQTLARLNLATTLAQLYGSFSFRLAEEVRTRMHKVATPDYFGMEYD